MDEKNPQSKISKVIFKTEGNLKVTMSKNDSDSKKNLVSNIEAPKDEIKPEDKDYIFEYLEKNFTSFNHQNSERKKEIVLEAIGVLCPSEIANSSSTKYFIPAFVEILKDKDVYDEMCVLLGTICDFNAKVQLEVFKRNVFEFLDFNYENTYFLILKICMNNKFIFDYFINSIYKKERDQKNERIVYLFEFFKYSD